VCAFLGLWDFTLLEGPQALHGSDEGPDDVVDRFGDYLDAQLQRLPLLEPLREHLQVADISKGARGPG